MNPADKKKIAAQLRAAAQKIEGSARVQAAGPRVVFELAATLEETDEHMMPEVEDALHLLIVEAQRRNPVLKAVKFDIQGLTGPR